MDDWRNISTAPKDGTEILACAKDTVVPGRWYRAVAQWAKKDPYWSNTIDGWFWPYAIRPTHWMPLPQPPQEKADEVDAD